MIGSAVVCGVAARSCMKRSLGRLELLQSGHWIALTKRTIFVSERCLKACVD
jgi:hypothetical protein